MLRHIEVEVDDELVTAEKNDEIDVKASLSLGIQQPADIM